MFVRSTFRASQIASKASSARFIGVRGIKDQPSKAQNDSKKSNDPVEQVANQRLKDYSKGHQAEGSVVVPGSEKVSKTDVSKNSAEGNKTDKRRFGSTFKAAKETVKDAANTVKDAANSAAGQSVKEGAKQGFEAVKENVKEGYQAAKDAANSTTAQNLKEGAKQGFQAVKENVKEGYQAAKDAANSSTAQNIKEGVKEGLQSAKSTVQQGYQAAKEAVNSSTAQNVKENVKEGYQAAKNAVNSSTAQNVKEEVREGYQAAKGAAQKGYQAAKEYVKEEANSGKSSASFNKDEMAFQGNRGTKDAAKDAANEAKHTMRDVKEGMGKVYQDTKNQIGEGAQGQTMADKIQNAAKFGASALYNKAKETVPPAASNVMEKAEDLLKSKPVEDAKDKVKYGYEKVKETVSSYVNDAMGNTADAAANRGKSHDQSMQPKMPQSAQPNTAEPNKKKQ
eukprot:TRINITY_DN1307_c0_g1_i1.p1 TRINITY_DN1307_c0_g1~~TRINITY_DN1307_c0_g1_i1.p1  ORF type:complete len:451 (-),score=181.07 TRINITY_DN1307_c0_g1_i1:53-1405(-)